MSAKRVSALIAALALRCCSPGAASLAGTEIDGRRRLSSAGRAVAVLQHATRR
jgi:hypothetical protein